MTRALACAFVLLAAGSLAHAQQAAGPGAFDCRMLANVPNAPMTVESCERRMAAHVDMMGALETPGGEPPRTIE